VRAAYERVAGMSEVIRRAGELSARTLIVDVEPMVAGWDSSQDALDRGVRLMLGQISAAASVQVACFATNSVRRPSAFPAVDGVQVIYLASARKPLRITPYLGFPRPGVVCGDQIATDGVLARRLDYTFLHYCPGAASLPAGPRLMQHCGWLVRPLIFSQSG
jgi:hypothetical protein